MNAIIQKICRCGCGGKHHPPTYLAKKIRVMSELGKPLSASQIASLQNKSEIEIDNYCRDIIIGVIPRGSFTVNGKGYRA